MPEPSSKPRSATEHRQLSAGWVGEVNEEALGDLVWEWLEKHGAKDLWLGCGPDEHPEDWNDSEDRRIRDMNGPSGGEMYGRAKDF